MELSEYTLKNISNFRIIYSEKRCLWTQMDRSVTEAANLEAAEKKYISEDCLPGWYVKPAMVAMFSST